MVHEIAAHRWRLQRSWSIETATIDNEMDLQSTTPHTDEPSRLAAAFKSLSDNSQALDVLGRYEYRLRRQFEQALSGYVLLRELAMGDSEERPVLAA